MGLHGAVCGFRCHIAAARIVWRIDGVNGTMDTFLGSTDCRVGVLRAAPGLRGEKQGREAGGSEKKDPPLLFMPRVARGALGWVVILWICRIFVGRSLNRRGFVGLARIVDWYRRNEPGVGRCRR